MLKYCLRENVLTAKPDDYMAQVADSQVFPLDDIIDRMVKRGGQDELNRVALT